MKTAVYKIGFIVVFIAMVLLGLRLIGWLDVHSSRFFAVMLLAGLICGALVRGMFGKAE